MKKSDENIFTEQNNDDVIDNEAVDALSSEPKKNVFFMSLLEQVELAVIVFAIIVIVFSFAFRTCRVSGPSMENTLYDGENVIITDLFYTPKRGDIVVFHQTGGKYNEPIVKRVIGLPGDTVKIEYFTDTMKVTVTDKDGNKSVLNETYIKYNGYPYYYNNSITEVEDGTVFVMGDNRNNSADSRSDDIGLVDTRRILGKIVFRFSPLTKIGAVR